LLSAPAANGTFSTLFCESFPRCLSPYPGGPAECTCLVLPQRHRPSPTEKRVGFPLLSREHDFSRTPISELQLFLYVQASEFVCLPGRSHRCKFPCRAAETFTSEQNVHRCLCTHRICYPPDYRQLAERGLSPRKIHSIVDRSSQFWGALHARPALHCSSPYILSRMSSSPSSARVRVAQAGAVQVFAVSSVSGPAEAERRQADHAPRPVS
jgi:hypothetical protein